MKAQIVPEWLGSQPVHICAFIDFPGLCVCVERESLRSDQYWKPESAFLLCLWSVCLKPKVAAPTYCPLKASTLLSSLLLWHCQEDERWSLGAAHWSLGASVARLKEFCCLYLPAWRQCLKTEEREAKKGWGGEGARKAGWGAQCVFF